MVTGFLGAGKTTLLEHILGSEPDRRFAIIENEFDGVGVDGLRVSAPGQAVFELNGGCVCCSVREDLLEAFERIIAAPDRFDHVIIETTGLAEPAPVMRLFDRPEIRDRLVLDGVITVVDAAHCEQSLNEVSACAEQIVYADVLVLNKIDQLDESQRQSVQAKLRQINSLAEILPAEHARVSPAAVLQLGGRSLEASGLKHPHHASGDHHDHAHEHEHHDEHDHQHDDTIRSIAVEVTGRVDLNKLDLWLGELVRSQEHVMLRMKGILAVSGYAQRFVFNGVRDAIEVRPDRSWGSDVPYCRMVFIGKELDEASLQAGFDACMAHGVEVETQK